MTLINYSHNNPDSLQNLDPEPTLRRLGQVSCCDRCHRCFLCFQMLCQGAYSCVCLLAAGTCCLVSATGLTQGPLCLYNTTTGPAWGVPLRPLADKWGTHTQTNTHRSIHPNVLSPCWICVSGLCWSFSPSAYLYNRTLWSGVCLQPHAVVEWNVVLFSLMGGASALQAVICAANILNSLLGLILGQGFCHNKVCELVHIQ